MTFRTVLFFIYFPSSSSSASCVDTLTKTNKGKKRESSILELIHIQ